MRRGPDDTRSRTAAIEAMRRREASAVRKLPGSRWREDHVTSALAALLIFGLFLDGWNHINLQDGELGSFFTFWHALLYAGFSSTALWVVTRNSHLYRKDAPPRPGTRDFLGVPLRYPLAVVGIGVATVGLFGDLVWHSVFGEETGVARVIGPFHIFLFAGAGLLVTASLRSAWAAPREYPASSSFRTFLPVLVALALITSMGAFLFQWLSAFLDWAPSLTVDRIPASLDDRQDVDETVQLASVARVVMTNLILMAPVMLALRRWRPPFGSITVLFVFVAVMMSSLAEFRLGWSVLAAIGGGLTADVLITRLRVSPSRPAAIRVVATATPAVMWTVYFLALSLFEDVRWTSDLAIGSILLAALGGLVLSTLVFPPAVPAGAWDELS
jgi:hypothetical protein